MSFKKFSMIIFIVGVLIALFSGAFDFQEGLKDIAVLVLILLGILVGILNISREETQSFLISSGVFLISSYLLVEILSAYDFIWFSNISMMLENLMIFISPAALTTAVSKVFDFASESDVQFYMEVPSAGEKTTIENIWDVIVFISVAFVFIILILENFFDLSPYPGLEQMLMIVDISILLIFVVDLFVVFRKSSGFFGFLRFNWLDIIAVIPFGSFFQAFKIVRAARIVGIIGRTGSLARVNRASKFFSSNSGFNNLLSPEQKMKQHRIGLKSKATNKNIRNTGSGTSKKRENRSKNAANRSRSQGKKNSSLNKKK